MIEREIPTVMRARLTRGCMNAKGLVTGISQIATLAGIGSLAKKGIEVTGEDSTRFNIGFFSKYCKRKILYPRSELEKTKFVRARRKVLAIKSIFFTQIIMLASQKPMTDLFSENLLNVAVL